MKRFPVSDSSAPRAPPGLDKALAKGALVLLLWSAASAAITIWLWRYNPLIPLFVGALLLFGGAVLLPERTAHRHIASVGFVVGFAVASWWFLLR